MFGALLVGGAGPTAVRSLVVLGFILVVAVVALRSPVPLVVIGTTWTAVTLAYLLVVRPSHDKMWEEDQQRLPGVTVTEDGFTVQHLRRFRYRSVDDYDAAWTQETYRFDDLEGADLGIEQFSSFTAVAHTFVCFRFRDGRVLVVSVEIRKEAGETFSPLRGLFRQYEKMVVLGDERDLVELRAVHRDDATWLYPMKVDVEDVERFLRSVLRETASIDEAPVFYNTLTASCSTSLGTHLHQMGALGFDARVYLPGYVDALAHEMGWLGDEPLDVLRERHRIDERARGAAGLPTFSERIRTP